METKSEKLNLEILLSCMNEEDLSIIKRINVQTDALMVNQNITNIFHEYEDISLKVISLYDDNNILIRRIDSFSPGLSKSRNLAIKNALGSVCLLCDDDEVLVDGYESIILKCYQKYKDADIICFHVMNLPSRLKQTPQHLNQWTVLRIASVQISFRRESILRSGILFDELLGAGTGNGAGEEIKFLRDCVKAGLHLYYVPENIGEISQEKSTWFNGFNRDFFYKRGITNRYIFGPLVATLYAAYYSIVKWKLYSKNLTMWQSFYYTMQGIIANDIVKEKKKQSK